MGVFPWRKLEAILLALKVNEKAYCLLARRHTPRDACYAFVYAIYFPIVVWMCTRTRRSPSLRGVSIIVRLTGSLTESKQPIECRKRQGRKLDWVRVQETCIQAASRVYRKFVPSGRGKSVEPGLSPRPIRMVSSWPLGQRKS